MSFDESNEFAIRVNNVSKIYQVYNKPIDRLKQSLFPRIQRLFGLPQKSYCREFQSLNNISFNVKKGETVGIVGRNGAGKSTLLQIICGTLSPTNGDVEVNGRVAALLELGAGFNPEFTGRENVYMSASILGLSQKQIDQRYDAIVKFADIGDYLDQPVKTYSSGMYVRLAFAVIAHVDADILVIDEALAVGDAFFTQKCMRFLRNFMKTGTVLFVSHDTASIRSLCQSAVLLNAGCVEMISDAKSVSEYYLEEIYRDQQEVDGVKKAEINSSLSRPEQVTTEQVTTEDNEDYTNKKGFGTGEVEILKVTLSDIKGQPLTLLTSNQKVTLSIRARSNKDISDIIIGFLVKNRLGQEIFGDNTTKSGEVSGAFVNKNSTFVTAFTFEMPSLATGDYSITVAVAEGSLYDHIQHNWIHDALIFKAIPNSPVYGLIDLPMVKEFKVLP
jgi:lipopolysaccharide transport system ATP-binding protein